MYILGGPAEIDDYVAGDLVIFTGYLYSPDYVYAPEDTRAEKNLGIVLGTVGGHYKNILYRVYWLQAGKETEVVGSHLRLAYVRENKQP